MLLLEGFYTYDSIPADAPPVTFKHPINADTKKKALARAWQALAPNLPDDINGLHVTSITDMGDVL